MPRHHRKVLGSRNYSNYSQADLERAVALIWDKKISQKKASEKFNIPRGTLQNRLNNRHMKQPGRPTVFNDVEENILVSHILMLSDYGFPMTSFDLRCFVKSYLDKNNRKIERFVNNFPGEDWAISFLKRHTLLSQRVAANIKKCRAKVTPDSIKEYLLNLKETTEGVPAANIWNYDETNLCDDPGQKKVLTKRGCKYPERVMSSTKSSTSVMFCGNAEGELLPPYVVYKAVCMWNSWVDRGPRGALYNRTKSGWFDSKCFEDWFELLALPRLKRQEGKKILLGDNLSSHISAHVLKLCEAFNIMFVALPPNSTHLTQPLDVAFFRPLKMEWRKILESYKMKHDGPVQKSHFPALLKSLMGEAMTKGESLKSGFKKCGIFPADENAVLKRMPVQYKKNDESINLHDSVVSDVSDAMVSFLSEKRYGTAEESTPKGRRKKLNVAPGKSITEDDLKNGETEPEKGKKRKRLGKENSQNKQRNRKGPTYTNEEQEDSDEADDVSAIGNDEELLEDTDNFEDNFDYSVGDFVIVDYEGEKFPGKILNCDVDGSCEVTVMRMRGNDWVWPERGDCIWYDKEKIMEVISKPRLNNSTCTKSRNQVFNVPEINKYRVAVNL